VSWILIGLGSWLVASAVLGTGVGTVFHWSSRSDLEGAAPPPPAQRPVAVAAAAPADRPLSVLVVDDDPSLRSLLRTTFELADGVVEEAGSADEALDRLDDHIPDAIVLDIGMPGTDGLTLCRLLRKRERTAAIPIVMLSGLVEEAELQSASAGADAFVHKPFSPLDLFSTILALTRRAAPLAEPAAAARTESQTHAYAADFGRLLEIGLRQQSQLENAYRQTVAALAAALEAKDLGTRTHSQRVVAYASELALTMAPELLDDPSLEYGFLLHDVGKIGIPDALLRKRGPLDAYERRLVERHPVIGAELLADVALLHGSGLDVVLFHHERWDGLGYPDRVAGPDIPLGARIFAVADTLDAMTADRPYRRALPWGRAVMEIRAETGRQFDPDVVEAFGDVEPVLRRIRERVAA
jgi:response regulator RpfG family c-di-GMP phosphodiesterase